MPPRWTKRKGEVLRGEEPPTPEPGPAFHNSSTRHGTAAGFRLHQVDDEEPCAPCRQAKAAYDYRWLGIPENTARNRLHAKAQSRAFQDLRRLHPEEYERIYERHKAALFEEAGIEPRRKGRPR